MRTRDAVLEYQRTLADAGTLTIDLDLVDPVSALELEFDATNGTTSNEDNFISDVITKVELVDGSTVLTSLSLAQLEALYFYKTGKSPTLFPSEWASGSQRHNVLLLFGRHLWDPTYAMDFTRYKNPQLKITSNLAAVRAVSATTAFATGTLRATAVAKVMEQTGSKPSKFLMQKEIESFTSAASGEKRIDMPVDFPYRMVMLRAYLEGYDPRELITDAKLTADTDAFIAFNRKVQQLDAVEFARTGWVELTHNIFRATGGVVRGLCQVETQFEFKPNVSTQFTVFVHTLNFSGNVTLETQTPAGASAGTRQYWGQEKGHALHGTCPFRFGLPDDPTTWFDPKTYKKLELILTQATVNGVCSVVAEQERPIG